MSESSSIAEQFWTLIHQYEDLLEFKHYREVPPCPINLGRLLTPEEDSLQKLNKEISECVSCTLRETASDPLPGKGEIGAKIMVVTSSPSVEDDQLGSILAGEDGAYFEKWIRSINLSMEKDCYLTSLVRCQTPGGRAPLKMEQLNCGHFLNREIQIVKPKLIVALGPMVYSSLTNNPAYAFDAAITPVCMASPQMIRSLLREYEGVPIVPLYHPKEVLQNPNLRRAVWGIMKRIQFLLD